MLETFMVIIYEMLVFIKNISIHTLFMTHR